MFKKSTQRTQLRNNFTMPLIFNIAPKNATSNIQKKETAVKRVIHKQNTNIINDSDNIMTWGKPVWYFLHCLASNIDATFFIDNRTEVLKIVYSICTNLPCHICSDHAKQYLDGINFNNIKTKDELKRHLYTFHNAVNKRKSFALFSENQLHKYDNVDMKNVVINFLTAFRTSSKLNIYSMSRGQTFNTVKQWINKNYASFI